MSPLTYSPDEVLDVVEQMQVLKYLDVATLAMLVLEYFDTLPLEIKLIWPVRLSYIKILYFLNRHIVFISVIAPIINSMRCQTLNVISNCARVVVVLISEALLFARVWALSGNSRMLGTFLFTFLLCKGGAAFALIILFALSSVFQISPYPEIVDCITVEADPRYYILCLSLILIEQISIMSLSLYLGIRKVSTSHLGRVLYRDGLMYFAALTALALLNLTLQETIKQNNTRYILNTFHFSMHSVLCTRMVLHLRDEARSTMGLTTTTTHCDDTVTWSVGYNSSVST